MLVRAPQEIKFPTQEYGWVSCSGVSPQNGRRLLVIKGHSGMSEWVEGLITVPENRIRIEKDRYGNDVYCLIPGNYIIKEGTDKKGGRIVRLYSAPEEIIPFYNLMAVYGFVMEERPENKGIKTWLKAEGLSRTQLHGTKWSLITVPNTKPVIVVSPYSYRETIESGHIEAYYTALEEKIAELEYHENGKLARRTLYKDGKIHGENQPAEIEYFDDGRIKIIRWMKDGVLHNDSGPAEIYYYHNRQKARESWYRNGNLHRDGGAAVISYYKNGEVKNIGWYKDGKLHREDGPAWREYYENGNIKSEEWHKNGIPHRTDGPALLECYEDGKTKTEMWYQEGKLHRTDGPAFLECYEDGKPRTEKWYQEGKLHRINGPAVLEYYKSGRIKIEEWWVNHKLHRTDGPACLRYSEDGEIEHEYYYLNGQPTNKEELVKYNKINELVKKATATKKISL